MTSDCATASHLEEAHHLQFAQERNLQEKHLHTSAPAKEQNALREDACKINVCESGRTQRGHHASLAAAGRSPRKERIGRSECG